ncbi:MAG TPA: hypothetical protein VF531_11450 [Bacillota bacterium]
MDRKSWLFACCALWVALVIWPDQAYAANQPYTVNSPGSPDFTADITLTDINGKVVTGKIFVKGGSVRQELLHPEGILITILRKDKSVFWTLMPGKRYMEMKNPVDPTEPQRVEFERELSGIESINGYDCEIIRYKYKNRTYGMFTVWFASKLNYGIRTETQSASGTIIATSECRNIKESTLNDALFEIPPGYVKYSLFKMRS